MAAARHVQEMRQAAVKLFSPVSRASAYVTFSSDYGRNLFRHIKAHTCNADTSGRSWTMQAASTRPLNLS